VLVGYARVSTQLQDTELQRVALEAAGCGRLFVEKASGAQRDRPELAAALEYMREGDTLIVWKLDRLARSLKQLIETVEALEARRIGFQSLTEKIDTTSPGGKLVFHLFAALAEFERGLIRERTLAGLASARAQGRMGGRPRALDAKGLSAAKAMLQTADLTVAEVARRLNVSPATLYRHLPKARAAGLGLPV
jgi:DNA invertase Pin-like site-specific DNA recombinase